MGNLKSVVWKQLQTGVRIRFLLQFIVENNELNNLGNLRFGAVVYRDYADLEATVEIRDKSEY